ncbi:hypothetical protein KFK14_11540 [Sphingobium phenoxybenzoativorans]|uniref:Uncharacterized protein n=1 Tax=Sphingobium phenoxybenzoativorans TaxID=1592790 RepID=A0A975Q3E2_9SPHN|nr:hypothetical protein [Sphingobium phenoxybenzoativorans]QUT07960.1 hypothetical protein KFK14_11540 [Sphingobium phenoxybenzoativorans]
MTSGAQPRWQWFWGYGSCPESYYIGEAAREATIDQARREAEGDTFTICEAHQGGALRCRFDAEIVLENFEEQNLDAWGEDGADMDLKDGARADLEQSLGAAFDAWFAKWKPCRRWTFTASRNEETFYSESEA